VIAPYVPGGGQTAGFLASTPGSHRLASSERVRLGMHGRTLAGSLCFSPRIRRIGFRLTPRRRTTRVRQTDAQRAISDSTPDKVHVGSSTMTKQRSTWPATGPMRRNRESLIKRRIRDNQSVCQRTGARAHRIRSGRAEQLTSIARTRRLAGLNFAGSAANGAHYGPQWRMPATDCWCSPIRPAATTVAEHSGKPPETPDANRGR
jgi:hypothetical protein